MSRLWKPRYSRHFALALAPILLARAGTQEQSLETRNPPALPGSAQSEGRHAPSYRVFAAKVSLPSITVVTNRVFLVADKVQLDLDSGQEQILRQVNPLSEQFGVPAPLLQRIVHRYVTNAPSPTAAIREMREAVTDYKYLLERWNGYRPPAGNEKLKMDALQLLQAGDLEKAWGMYNSLPRPAPPGGLRVLNPQR